MTEGNFIDYIKIYASSGKGGRGSAHLHREKFISKGDKVKFTIRFKGRELQHSHLGNELMTKIKEDMKKVGKVELHPKFDGKQMIMVIQPL